MVNFCDWLALRQIEVAQVAPVRGFEMASEQSFRAHSSCEVVSEQSVPTHCGFEVAQMAPMFFFVSEPTRGYSLKICFTNLANKFRHDSQMDLSLDTSNV